MFVFCTGVSIFMLRLHWNYSVNGTGHMTQVGQEYILVDVHSQAATEFLNSLVEIATQLCCSLTVVVFVFVVVIIMRFALNNSQNASNQKGNKISNKSR